MNDEALNWSKAQPSRRVTRLMILLAGIVLGQVVLYGPSLAGRKVLLPLDILAEPGTYLPRTPEVAKIVPQNTYLTDLLYLCEPARRLAVSEIQAGRLPMWAPYHFAGVPFIWPKFSPFLALQCATASPVVLAWTQLLAAIVAGLGAYLFCRRALAVSFWPAAIAGWCYPLTGFFVFWQGFPTGVSVHWLPWIQLAVDRTVRGGNPRKEGPLIPALSPSEGERGNGRQVSGESRLIGGVVRGSSPLAPLALSVVTCLVLVSGHLDVAGQVLLVSGLYALWCLYDVYAVRWFQRRTGRAVLALAAGWGLGLLLAAPYILPVVEYTRTGARMAGRSAGLEERPPVGLAALPETVLPDLYGADRTGSLRVASQNQLESAAAAYTGVLATLLAAPLAWCSRRHRSSNVFWVLLSLGGLSWCLDLPGCVEFLRLPGLNMMSHNRLVFATSFAILALMAVGLEVLRQGLIERRWWLWLPATLLAALCAWCVYLAVFLPEPIHSQLELSVREGNQVGWIHDLEGVRRVQTWYVRHYAAMAVWCGIGLAGWLILWSRRAWQSRLLPVAAALLVGDLLWFAHGRSVQCDPALYFPPVPVLDAVARSAPGRVIGYNCLPASLAAMRGLRDIRGYDSVDPARMIDLLGFAAVPQSKAYFYALTQEMTPKAEFTPEGAIRLSPILDMLGVRYVILRGAPSGGTRPAFQGPDYWVMVNSNALARTFVPRRVETVTEDKARLEKLASPEFDPRDVAYVESPVDLPNACRGSARIVEEIPTRVTVSVRMETPGLVVLADLWDKGWRADWNGQRVPILRANQALRGVVLPAGEGTLVFRYAPASFAWGLRLAGLAVVVLLAWLGIILWQRRNPKPETGLAPPEARGAAPAG